MSVMIKVLLDHKLKAWEDPILLPRILGPSLNCFRAIDAYPNDSKGPPSPPIQRSDFQYSSFKGLNLDCPGRNRITFTDKMAYITASYRWSSFLQRPDVRTLHLKAFRSVARCLNSTFAAYFAENDLVYECFRQGSDPAVGFKILTDIFGEPKPDPEDISQEDIKRRPSHWYLEFFNHK